MIRGESFARTSQNWILGGRAGGMDSGNPFPSRWLQLTDPCLFLNQPLTPHLTLLIPHPPPCSSSSPQLLLLFVHPLNIPPTLCIGFTFLLSALLCLARRAFSVYFISFTPDIPFPTAGYLYAGQYGRESCIWEKPRSLYLYRRTFIGSCLGCQHHPVCRRCLVTTYVLHRVSACSTPRDLRARH